MAKFKFENFKVAEVNYPEKFCENVLGIKWKGTKGDALKWPCEPVRGAQSTDTFMEDYMSPYASNTKDTLTVSLPKIDKDYDYDRFLMDMYQHLLYLEAKKERMTEFFETCQSYIESLRKALISDRDSASCGVNNDKREDRLIRVIKKFKALKKKLSEWVKMPQYLCQIHEDKLQRINMEDNAKVIDLKKEIARIYKIKDVKLVRVLFAGKELLDNIVLKSLNVGDAVIFVYIRSEEDLLLLTAKALRVDDDDEYEYEYEYEEEEEDK